MAATRRNEPSTGKWATFFEIIFGLVVGALFCAAWLVLKPVEVVDAPPKPASVETGAVDRHLAYFVRGKTGARGSAYARKQKALLQQDPRGVEFTEEEVNRWISATYGRVDLTKKNEDFDAEVIPNLPMVRLDGDRMDIGMELQLSLMGLKKVVVAQARGTFAQRGETFEFVPERVMLGSCPLPWNLGGSSVYRMLSRMFVVPDPVATAWRGVKDVRVAESKLRVGLVPEVKLPEPAAVPAPAAVQETPAPVVASPDVVEPASPPPAAEPVADVSPEAIAPASEVTGEAPAAAVEPVAAPVASETSMEPAATPAAEENTAAPAPTEPVASEPVGETTAAVVTAPAAPTSVPATDETAPAPAAP